MSITQKLSLSVFILVVTLFAYAEQSNSLQKVINKYKFNESEFSFGIVNLADDQVIGLHNEKKLFNSIITPITIFWGLRGFINLL